MTVVADDTQEVKWQAKYLEQIHARLANTEDGVRDLRTEIRGVRDHLEAKIVGVRDELRVEIRGVRDQLDAKIVGVRDELRGEIRGVRDQLDAKINGVRDELQGETRGFRDELRHEIREVRNLVLGMFAFVVTAVVGAVIKTFL